MSSAEDFPEQPGDKHPVPKKHAGQRSDTGAALRGIYQNTIDEQIPEDLLSLLRKLD